MLGIESAEMFLANVKSRYILPSMVDDSVTRSGLELSFINSSRDLFW